MSDSQYGQGMANTYSATNILVQFFSDQALDQSSLMQDSFALLRYLRDRTGAQPDTFSRGRSFNFAYGNNEIAEMTRFIVNLGSNVTTTTSLPTDLYDNNSTESNIDTFDVENDKVIRIAKQTIPVGTHQGVDAIGSVGLLMIQQAEVIVDTLVQNIAREFFYNAGNVNLATGNALNDFDPATDAVPSFFNDIIQTLQLEGRTGTSPFLCMSHRNYSTLSTSNLNVQYRITGDALAIEDPGIRTLFGIESISIPEVVHTNGSITGLSADITSDSNRTNREGDNVVRVSTTGSGAVTLTRGDFITINGHDDVVYMVRRDVTLTASQTNQPIYINRGLIADVGDSTQSVSLALTGTSYALNFAANLGAVVVNLRGGPLGENAMGLQDYYNRNDNLIPDLGPGTVGSGLRYTYVPQITAATATPVVFGLQFGENAQYAVTSTTTYGAGVAIPREVIAIPSAVA